MHRCGRAVPGRPGVDNTVGTDESSLQHKAPCSLGNGFSLCIQTSWYLAASAALNVMVMQCGPIIIYLLPTEWVCVYVYVCVLQIG